MSMFHREAEGVLHVESVAIPRIVQALGTPLYVYSKRHLEDRFAALQAAVAGAGNGTRLHYAVKANPNLAILDLFNLLGAGFDIVSGGELARVMAAGGDPGGVVFSGVGKSTAEIDLACKLGIHCFNVESAGELARLAERAALLSRPARVAIRVNPDVDPETHPYISTGLKDSKFGVPLAEAPDLFRRAAASDWLQPVGIACHIGSQIRHPDPLLEALGCLLRVVDALGREGIHLEHLDLGGGFGVAYGNEPDFEIHDYGARVRRELQGRDLSLAIEPGRFLVANGGALITRVEYLKPGLAPEDRQFAVVDAAMNDLIRPALYQAWHDVLPVGGPGEGAIQGTWDVVGPVCESTDFLARDRELAIAPGDLLAICSAGAYAMSQSSNYNGRPRPAEVLVDGADFHLIRRRETAEDLYRHEVVP